MLSWVGLTAAAMAAPVGGSVDSGGSTTSDAATGAKSSSASGKALKYAPTGEASTGDKNLDLLLELNSADFRDSGGAAAHGTQAQRANGSRTAGRAASNSASALDMDRRALLGGDTGLRQSRGNEPDASPDWMGNRRSAADAREAAALPQGQGPGGVRPGDDDDNPLRDLIRSAANFLREYRTWLLGGGALILLIGAIFKIFGRRI